VVIIAELAASVGLGVTAPVQLDELGPRGAGGGPNALQGHATNGPIMEATLAGTRDPERSTSDFASSGRSAASPRSSPSRRASLDDIVATPLFFVAEAALPQSAPMSSLTGQVAQAPPDLRRVLAGVRHRPRTLTDRR
jgi:hypothetical protein